MTRSTLTSMTINTPDLASLQAAITKISNALTEIGLAVEPSVSGQINIPVDVTYPTPAVNSINSFGFEIRKLVNPGLPTIYIRIDYQRYSLNTVNTGCHVAFRINTGTTVTSAGVLGGTRPSTLASNWTSGVVSSSTFLCFFASDGKNYFTMGIAPNYQMASNTGSLGCYAVERTRDRLSGLYDGEGQVTLFPTGFANTFDSLNSSNSGTARVNILNFTNLTGASSGVAFFASIGNMWGSTGSYTGDSASLSPMPVGIPKLKGVASVVLGYWRDEIPLATEMNVDLYGQTMRFIALGAPGIFLTDSAISAAMRPALRID